MSAEDIFKQAVADILSADTGLGISATFTPLTGAAIPMDVSLNKQTEIQPSGNAQTWEIGNTIEYSLEDLDREAVVGETFTIGETIYTVKKVESNNGYTVKVVVK